MSIDDRTRRLHRLMVSAVAWAQNERAAWDVLRGLLLRWATGNEQMRLELLRALQEAGRGKQGEYKKPPLRDDIELVLWVEECINRHGSIQYGLDHIADGPGEERYPQDPKALRERHRAAIKRVASFGYGRRESKEEAALLDKQALAELQASLTPELLQRLELDWRQRNGGEPAGALATPPSA